MINKHPRYDGHCTSVSSVYNVRKIMLFVTAYNHGMLPPPPFFFAFCSQWVETISKQCKKEMGKVLEHARPCLQFGINF